MADEADSKIASPDVSTSKGETFHFIIEPNPHPIELFELTFPRPPQGTWRETFDIRADVRFAHVILGFENISVRVATKGARLSSACTGCALLPHSLYGLNPLPARNIIAVQEKQTREIGASGSAEIQMKAGGLQVFDGSASVGAKTSGEAAHRVERQGAREESVARVVPRPHGAWDLSEPYNSDGCLDGDYLTSRGQYLDAPSQDPTDMPLATVQADESVDEIIVELSVEIQPKDLVFHRIKNPGGNRAPGPWFQREKINVEIVARRLIELTHKDATVSDSEEVRINLGKATLRGKRRAILKGS